MVGWPVGAADLGSLQVDPVGGALEVEVGFHVSGR